MLNRAERPTGFARRDKVSVSGEVRNVVEILDANKLVARGLGFEIKFAF
jgi:hypothetical protein